MKKESNKKRKLKYIREKNHYRKGGSGSMFIKISSDFLCKSSNIIESEISKKIHLHSKKFKIKFDVFEYNVGLVDEDFIQDLHTINFLFRKK